MTASLRSFSSRSISVFVVTALLCGALSFASLARAEDPTPPVTRTTMVVLSDHPLDDGQWTALVAELHRGRTSVASFIPVIGGDVDIDVLQGRDMNPGVVVQKAITIFLKGDCTLMPRSRKFVEGALGWVKEVRGRIQPFIHVECERIVEMLGPVALGMNRERRDTVMAEAIVRVVLHEWVHIATQQAGHARSGITQSEFQVSDLLADDRKLNPRGR